MAVFSHVMLVFLGVSMKWMGLEDVSPASNHGLFGVSMKRFFLGPTEVGDQAVLFGDVIRCLAREVVFCWSWEGRWVRWGEHWQVVVGNISACWGCVRKKIGLSREDVPKFLVRTFGKQFWCKFDISWSCWKIRKIWTKEFNCKLRSWTFLNERLWNSPTSW